MSSVRTSTKITFAVWKALFLREALTRLFSSRAAWFWLLAEPVLNIYILIFLYTVVRARTVGGIDTLAWIMIGMLAFFMFRRTGTQLMNAINANQALFAYRQVKPVDTVLVRGGLEGFIMIIIVILLLAGAALFGHPVIPADPLAALEAFVGLWLVGIGYGLITSVANELVPEIGKLVNLTMQPLYFISGVIIPLTVVPQPYRGWLLLNPVAHGVEAARLGFVPHYQVIPELSLAYLFGFALISIFLGLALHHRFALRLRTL